MPHFPRFLKDTLDDDLRLYPAVAVMGARQVGKSTLCRAIADERGMAYRTLDDLDIREQALRDPDGLLAACGSHGAVLDEVQRAPALLLALKAVVDREQRSGRYLLCGSNQPAMSNAVGDSLLGRSAYRTLRPLTLSEQRLDDTYHGWSFLFGASTTHLIEVLAQRAESNGPLDWKTVVATGGFPRALAAPPEHRARLLDDYVETFVRRDIRDVLQIESPERFDSFFRLVATRTAQELVPNRLSSDLGTPVQTIRRWVDALGRSYLIERIPPLSGNAGSRVIQAQKLYIADVALALAAAREVTPTGFHLETLIVNDLCAWRDGAPGRALYHWRIASGAEVDFVLEERGRLIPVEIKAANGVDAGDARHLRTFRSSHAGVRRAFVLSADPEVRELSDGVVAAPWWAVI